MLLIPLEKELEQRLDLLTESTGKDRTDIVREAIIRYLEDNEDLELARQALAKGGERKSLKELRVDLGLDG